MEVYKGDCTFLGAMREQGTLTGIEAVETNVTRGYYTGGGAYLGRKGTRGPLYFGGYNLQDSIVTNTTFQIRQDKQRQQKPIGKK